MLLLKASTSHCSSTTAGIRFGSHPFLAPYSAYSRRPCSLSFAPAAISLSSAAVWHQPTKVHPCSRTLARVISEEPEGNPSADDVVFDEEALQRDLERAIKEEDYAHAAWLRDHLRLLQEDSKSAVLSANARFYHAFKNGDLAAMHSVWSKGDHVYVIHPAAGRISGYDLVMGSWEIVCNADYEFPLQIDLKNVEVHVRGNIGYVSCMEVVKSKGSGWGKQVATNVFEKVDGQWFMCIHHASHMDE